MEPAIPTVSLQRYVERQEEIPLVRKLNEEISRFEEAPCLERRVQRAINIALGSYGLDPLEATDLSSFRDAIQRIEQAIVRHFSLLVQVFSENSPSSLIIANYVQNPFISSENPPPHFFYETTKALNEALRHKKSKKIDFRAIRNPKEVYLHRLGTIHWQVKRALDFDPSRTSHDTPHEKNSLIAACEFLPSMFQFYPISPYNSKNPLPETAQLFLHRAARSGLRYTIRSLSGLTTGVNDRASAVWAGLAPLHLAAIYNQCPAIIGLYRTGADLDIMSDQPSLGTPLHAAVKYGNILAIETLCKKGANVNKQNALGQTPLHLVFNQDNFKDFEASLLNPSHQPSPKKWMQNAMAMIKVLIHWGADVTIPDERGVTPLHVFASNQFDLRLKIRDYGAVDPDDPSINHQVSKEDALEETEPMQAPLKFLLKNAKEIDLRDHDGNTPLHAAVKHRLHYNIPTLLYRGADPHALNHEGKTPLQIAEENQDDLAMEYFTDALTRMEQKNQPHAAG